MSHSDLIDAGIQSGQQRYHSILLRYWREDEPGVWRYVAQDLVSGEHYRFASLDLLIAFLYRYLENQAH